MQLGALCFTNTHFQFKNLSPVNQNMFIQKQVAYEGHELLSEVICLTSKFSADNKCVY